MAELAYLRDEFHSCLTRRGDALFELADALLCADGPVRSLVGLSLAPEHRRGHGALYDALNHGRIDDERLRNALVRLPLPRAVDGRIVLAVDVSPWLRPDANTSRGRSFCHTYGRGEGKHQMVPGWPPGRPRGSKNRGPAPRYDVGRIVKTGERYSRPSHHNTGTKPRRTG